MTRADVCSVFVKNAAARELLPIDPPPSERSLAKSSRAFLFQTVFPSRARRQTHSTSRTTGMFALSPEKWCRNQLTTPKRTRSTLFSIAGAFSKRHTFYGARFLAFKPFRRVFVHTTNGPGFVTIKGTLRLTVFVITEVQSRLLILPCKCTLPGPRLLPASLVSFPM